MKAVISAQPAIAHSYARCRAAADAHPYSCFELLGLDFLIDEDSKPWLLEINHSREAAPGERAWRACPARVPGRVPGSVECAAMRILRRCPVHRPPSPSQ